MTRRTVALIPLRGGSKSIKRKNIRCIAGKPLCAWVLEAAHSAKFIDEVFVSTEDQEIAKVVERLGYGTSIVWRPQCLATDDASTESVMLDFAGRVGFDTLVTIQATSPLTRSRDLEAAAESFVRDGFDSMLTAVRVKRFFWSDEATPLNYDPMCRPRRQDFKGTYMENGAFYFTRREILEHSGCRLGGAIGIYEMEESTMPEIDEPNDWFTVERLLAQRLAEASNY